MSSFFASSLFRCHSSLGHHSLRLCHSLRRYSWCHCSLRFCGSLLLSFHHRCHSLCHRSLHRRCPFHCHSLSQLVLVILCVIVVLWVVFLCRRSLYRQRFLRHCFHRSMRCFLHHCCPSPSSFILYVVAVLCIVIVLSIVILLCVVFLCHPGPGVVITEKGSLGAPT